MLTCYISLIQPKIKQGSQSLAICSCFLNFLSKFLCFELSAAASLHLGLT